jgi:DNA repair protein SbcD/Mre11
MLGHIHKHQSWREQGRAIAYAGSIGRFHYGEIGEKGYLLWEVGTDTATFELVPMPAKTTIDISFDGLPDMNELRELAGGEKIANAHVRVRWSVPDEQRHQVERAQIEALFSHAAEVKLEGRVIPVVRARAQGINAQSGAQAKLTRWAQATGVDAAALLDCLQALQNANSEEIAAQILAGAVVGDAEALT